MADPDPDAAWVAWFLALPHREQLTAAAAIRRNSHRRWQCDAYAHRRYLREAREAGAIP